MFLLNLPEDTRVFPGYSFDDNEEPKVSTIGQQKKLLMVSRFTKGSELSFCEQDEAIDDEQQLLMRDYSLTKTEAENQHPPVRGRRKHQKDNVDTQNEPRHRSASPTPSGRTTQHVDPVINMEKRFSWSNRTRIKDRWGVFG